MSGIPQERLERACYALAAAIDAETDPAAYLTRLALLLMQQCEFDEDAIAAIEEARDRD